MRTFFKPISIYDNEFNRFKSRKKKQYGAKIYLRMETEERVGPQTAGRVSKVLAEVR